MLKSLLGVLVKLGRKLTGSDSSRDPLHKPRWKRSPTKQYARGGPQRGGCMSEPQRPSRQIVLKGECLCSEEIRNGALRYPVAHARDGKSDTWVCSKCSRVVEEEPQPV